MRYRAMGSGGAIISALTIGLKGDPSRPRAGDWVPVLYAALENGINGFDVDGPDVALADGFAEAFAGVERHLAFVSWRLGQQPGGGRDFSGEALTGQVRTALGRTGLGYLDSVVLDDPQADELSDEALEALKQLKAAGLVRFLGVAGESDAIEARIASGVFDILATPFNLISGWRERHRLRSAGACDMAVMGYRSFPTELRQRGQAAAAAPAKVQNGWKNPLSGAGTYAFLEQTHGWQPDEICLAYALTEPCLSTVQVRPANLAELERLAAVVDRDMPPGLAAQIEMARFSPEQEGARARA